MTTAYYVRWALPNTWNSVPPKGSTMTLSYTSIFKFILKNIVDQTSCTTDGESILEYLATSDPDKIMYIFFFSFIVNDVFNKNIYWYKCLYGSKFSYYYK